MTMNHNALPDDPDWCGHAFVSLRTWTCADCDRPVTPATRSRLEHAPTAAPDGSLWVLISGDQDHLSADDDIIGYVVGLFIDRATIARILIRDRYCDAEDIRAAMRRSHWYQGAFNAMVFEGWSEDDDDNGCYSLTLEEIDHRRV